MTKKHLLSFIMAALFLLSNICPAFASILKDEEVYETALDSLESYLEDPSSRDLANISNNFYKLKDYKFSYLFYLYTAILLDIKDENYNDALDKLDSSIKNNPDFLAELHDNPALRDLNEIRNYTLAKQAEANGDYYMARNYYKMSSSVLDSNWRYDELKKPAQEQLYSNACSLMETADGMQQAYNQLLALHQDCGEYKDSMQKLAELQAALSAPSPTDTPDSVPDTVPSASSHPLSGCTSFSVRDIIEFGRYEQDNNIANGSEPIKWLILDIKDGEALVISLYVLERHSYHTKQKATTWEECELRGWLNYTFYNNAFSDQEKQFILKKTINPVDSFKEGNSAKSMGNPTEDFLFLLNVYEAETYFSSNGDRQAHPTAYAKNAGVSTEESSNRCNWILRQPYKKQTQTASINYEGDTRASGVNITAEKTGIRPALWIQLPSQEQ